ncbi:DUF7882 family protein [Leifsonia sp. 2MCAF36]|uniref:DUF7882 family protein n=1 Tax=Leifsonia sp. 2MCAF36 TaxID=3232988 RepID=UPI003F9D75D2
MGVLSYGGTDYVLDDRLLAHLQIVITTKLRRRESFALSWVPDGDSGREAIWVDNGLPIRFRYHESAISPLNREWLEVLMDGTHRPNGLLVAPEPARQTDQARRPSAA